MYTIKSNDTRMYTAYERISKGTYLDNELKPYTRKFIKEVIDYFEKKEEYEKCTTLQKALSDIEHEKNFTRWNRQMI